MRSLHSTTLRSLSSTLRESRGNTLPSLHRRTAVRLLRYNLSLPGAKPLRATDRLLKIQFKRRCPVAFVIVSQLSRAFGPLRIRKSEEHAEKKKDGPLCISFFPFRKEFKYLTPHHGEPLLVIGMR